MSAAVIVASFASPARAQEPEPGCARAGIDDKCEDWVVTYDDNETTADATESPADIAVSPDGEFVYSAVRTIVGHGFDAKYRWAILAHDGAGQREWLSRWGNPDHYNFVTSIAVSRDGRLVFASGTWRTEFVASDGHLTTVAFDARTGEVVWTANYDGPGNGTDNARDIVVSPDGRTLYVAGISAGRDNSDLDFAAIAYDTQTGRELFVSRWDGVGEGNVDSPFAIEVSPRGDIVYLTGWSFGKRVDENEDDGVNDNEFNNDFGTIAVDAVGDDAGRILWSARYDGVGVRAPDQASDLTVSPDGATVFVTGMSNDVEGGPPFAVNYGYATVAYDAVTGAQLWDTRKQWPETNFNSPTAMAIDPGGRMLVVTGQAGRGQLDFGTVAYDPRTGAEVWSDRYGLPEHDFELGKELVMDPRGDTFYVAGISAKSPPGVPGVVLYAPNADHLSIAYDVMTGQKRWLARFNPAATDFVSVQSMAISPDASRLYSIASIDDQNWDADGDDVDTGIIAYEIGAGIPIPPPPTVLSFTDQSDTRGQYSDETRLSAVLTTVLGEPIEGAKLTFEFQGAQIPAVTDPAGIASVTDTLVSPPDEYQLSVTYAGDEDHREERSDALYTIEREVTGLVIEVDKKGRTLRATLQDQDSSAGIVEREIVFYYKDEVIGRATTDDSGIATLTGAAEARRAQHHLEAVFDGDPFYEASSTGDDTRRR
ncbi:MAG: PQQ-binding-like beta-propeller repeat protein [Actinomycetota bacterium]